MPFYLYTKRIEPKKEKVGHQYNHNAFISFKNPNVVASGQCSTLTWPFHFPTIFISSTLCRFFLTRVVSDPGEAKEPQLLIHPAVFD